MTNANFTFLIFFHKTPLSKGRLGYQSPFPFCVSNLSRTVTQLCCNLKFKNPARAFL